MRGIGEIRPDTQGFDLGDKTLMSPIIDAAEKNNMTILTHSSEPVGISILEKAMCCQACFIGS